MLVRDYAAKTGGYPSGATIEIATWTLPPIQTAEGTLYFDYQLRTTETALKAPVLALNGATIQSVSMDTFSLFKARMQLDYQDGGYYPELTTNSVSLGLGAAYGYPLINPARVAWDRTVDTEITLSLAVDPASAGGFYQLDYMRIYVR